ncbi:hypothetical protein GCM10025857_46070 [Alicyclobacillus contaminans]|nr:hypothetical protein GCM10025857_46070 [Alicyclobacillus contaminans]
MKTYDYIVVGGGSGGIASANRAANHGAKVLLIEAKELGGTCINVGCVPKKVMWQASDIYQSIQRDAPSYGIQTNERSLDFKTLVKNREDYIEFLHGAYQRGFDNSGVEFLRGYAQFIDNHTVEVEGQQYSASHVLIATGGHADALNIPGGEYAIDSDGFFALDQAPEHMIVLGAAILPLNLQV